MGAELTIEYQNDADILLISKCPSYIGQDEDEIDDLVCARTNPATGEIEYIEIVFFKAHLNEAGVIALPIDATLITLDAEAPMEFAHPQSTDQNLTIKYAQPADILTLALRPPHPGLRWREIYEDISAGLNEATGQIEGLEIRSFKARMERDGKIALPIEASLRLVEPAQVPE